MHENSEFLALDLSEAIDLRNKLWAAYRANKQKGNHLFVAVFNAIRCNLTPCKQKVNMPKTVITDIISHAPEIAREFSLITA